MSQKMRLRNSLKQDRSIYEPLNISGRSLSIFGRSGNWPRVHGAEELYAFLYQGFEDLNQLALNYVARQEGLEPVKSMIEENRPLENNEVYEQNDLSKLRDVNQSLRVQHGATRTRLADEQPAVTLQAFACTAFTTS